MIRSLNSIHRKLPMASSNSSSSKSTRRNREDKRPASQVLADNKKTAPQTNTSATGTNARATTSRNSPDFHIPMSF